MFEIVNTLLSSNASLILKSLVIFMFTVFVFSYTTKQLEENRNKKALRNLYTLLITLLRKFEEANTHVNEISLLRRKISYWLSIIIYCLFSATFWIYSIAVGLILASSNVTGYKGILAVLFVGFLFVVANMYHVAAQKCYQKVQSI